MLHADNLTTMHRSLVIATAVVSALICGAAAQQSDSGSCSFYGVEGEIPEGWYTYCSRFHRWAMETAHWNVPNMPCGTRLRVTNQENGRSVTVTVNDKGPNRNMHPDRILDLTYGAFGQIADHDKGLIRCSYEVV